MVRETQKAETLKLKLTFATQHRGDISKKERREYIAAMLCLMSRPSRLDQTEYPGAKTRYDDFVAVHINQTLAIHGTVSIDVEATWTSHGLTVL